MKISIRFLDFIGVWVEPGPGGHTNKNSRRSVNQDPPVNYGRAILTRRPLAGARTSVCVGKHFSQEFGTVMKQQVTWIDFFYFFPSRLS